MTDLFSINPIMLVGQIMVGLINGSFYAMLSLGLAIIFGLLNTINFAHGAFYMLGAVFSWMLFTYAGIGFWPALLLSPLAAGLIGTVVERGLLRRIYNVDHVYGLLLTYGLALIIVGIFLNIYGNVGQIYQVPALLTGGQKVLGIFLPNYRLFVVLVSMAVCLAVWLAIERTRLGSWLRAATEDALLVEAYGVNVPLLVTATFAFGVALAALAGVLAAPIYSVNPSMGNDVIIVVFAVVVIGGLGSIGGAILTGFALGVIEGLTKVFYPQASSTVIFVIMAIVLLLRPRGLFGRGE